MEIKTLTKEQAKNLAEQDRLKDSLKEIEDQETLDLLK